MKRVKKINGYYTLENEKRAEDNQVLCTDCGNVECPIRGVLMKLQVNRLNAKLNVLRCESFIPILEFRDHNGMAHEFNTFRLGSAWVNRVDPGQLVSLRNTKAGWSGIAEVLSIHNDTFKVLAPKFATNNHLSIHAELNEEEFDLETVMRQCYGGHRFNVDSKVTVIEMRRFSGADS